MGAPHRRTRERFLALHEIARGGCATRVAVRAGRHPQTVTGWLHACDAHGPDAPAYRGTGGRPPLCPHRGGPRRDRSRRPAYRRRPARGRCRAGATLDPQAAGRLGARAVHHILQELIIRQTRGRPGRDHGVLRRPAVRRLPTSRRSRPRAACLDRELVRGAGRRNSADPAVAQGLLRGAADRPSSRPDRLVQASPTVSTTTPLPPQSGQGSSSTRPVPRQVRQMFSAVWEAPGDASSPGFLPLDPALGTCRLS